MISGFSFDGHQIGKPRFAKIRSVDCCREASLGIQLKPCSWHCSEGLEVLLEGHGPPVEKDCTKQYAEKL